MKTLDMFLLIGQSNAMGVGNHLESVAPNENAYEYLSTNEIIPMRTVLEGSNGKGNIAPAFSNDWINNTKNSVCFVHSPKDGSIINNWVKAKYQFLAEAVDKFNKAVSFAQEKYKIGKKYAIWIQGESDVEGGCCVLYYRESLKYIADTLKEKCGIEKTFVSLTGYWRGNEGNEYRTKRIACAQELACKQSPNLALASKRAMTFSDEDMYVDLVHYNQEALNILGKDLCKNVYYYYKNNKEPHIEDTINLDVARKYTEELENINKKYR